MTASIELKSLRKEMSLALRKLRKFEQIPISKRTNMSNIDELLSLIKKSKIESNKFADGNLEIPIFLVEYLILGTSFLSIRLSDDYEKNPLLSKDLINLECKPDPNFVFHLMLI